MAAWGYEFYLLVLKVSLTRERYFQHSKIKFVSPRGHVISSISFLGKEPLCILFHAPDSLGATLPFFGQHNHI